MSRQNIAARHRLRGGGPEVCQQAAEKVAFSVARAAAGAKESARAYSYAWSSQKEDRISSGLRFALPV
jgi:hypothetical protein